MPAFEFQRVQAQNNNIQYNRKLGSVWFESFGGAGRG